MLAASTEETSLEDLLRWFAKGHAHSSVGTYEIRGRRLRFSATTSHGVVDYDGTIDGDTLDLRWHSHINGADGTRTYRFLPAAVQ